MKIWQRLNQTNLTFFGIAVVLFWIKTYVAYRVEFKLGIDNSMQKFLLALNPLSSALFFLGLAFLSKKRTKLVMIIINFLLSFLLYANIVYYRFFNDFITIPVLLQAKSNAGQLGDSAGALMAPTDVFYFTDTILLILLALFAFKKVKQLTSRRPFQVVLLFSVMVFLFNLNLAEKDRSDLLTRTFDRNYLVKYLGAYNFTIYDIVQNIRTSSERVMANGSDITNAENYHKANYTQPNPALFGKAKGMNVIYVSLESFQNFMIDYKLNGQEVTPFLNSLAHDNNTFYFDNFYHQTGQGKTSDAEFLMENSLYPLNQGAVFVNKAQNTYQATPAILKGYGYNSAVFHGNYKTFWNRNVMYKALGYDQFFDASYYDMSAGNIKNYGMKDIPYFKESMPMLESLKQPFYTKFITLSNHYPFEIDPGDTTFPAGDFGDPVVNDYFQSAHYMDEALQQFFDSLKADGLYDKSVIVLYGDHYGLSENHNKAMAKVLGVPEITPTINASLQETPLFIHVPGVQGGVQHQYAGEVDVRPTLLHLLGIDTKDYIEFGSDMLSPQHRNWALFRNGDFVSPTVDEIGGKCYSTQTGQVEANNSACKPIDSQLRQELQMSDDIVNKDLLRFYKPKGFTPINPNDYQYLGPKKARTAKK
ncbi:LTA synthase family protein [Neobacillus sp. PS3-12]|uniref:LTA synthase family protein n=1 Tax=Neobacillus sp. PS3-12 TaxID=3070677 RepID=UPI0027E0BDC7|nr:LTA synthase family protein [Neobacillus sp. PS3-12]WML55747.1 LTA synthase family protein [Neobacillus sp. PS3-12]